MNDYSLVLIIIAYLVLLFYIAYIGDKHSRRKWVNSPYIYTLSLAVYCSAWTYYGSVGTAANSGVNFLPIYIGPIIAIPLWIVLMRKIIRIAKQHNVASIADFISLRYGRNRFLGALITIICLIATVPYISLQLKAISESFQLITTNTNFKSNVVFRDSTFYIAFILAIFVTFYGTRKSDASSKNKGIMATIAFESILKLVFFISIGIYVTFYLFDGTTDIHNQISKQPNFDSLIGLGGIDGVFNWFLMILLSFFAIFLLPRQFQVGVVEIGREKHLKTAIWLFPLYLLLFVFFVIFIAWAGKLSFPDTVNADYYTILLPLSQGNILMALLVFIGGFSAVVSMVVVSTIALSNMVSNNLIIPYGFLDKFIKGNPDKNLSYIKNIRRIAIFMIFIIAYAFYANFSIEISLFSIGLISFVIIALLAPSFFIGLFWNRGSSLGATLGIIVGFLIIVYTLIIPFFIEAYGGSQDFIEYGLFGIKALKPYTLFGIDFLTPPVHAFFWSLITNVVIYIWASLLTKGNYRERNYAEMFINSKHYDSLQDSAYVWKGEAYVDDIKNVLVKFLGETRTQSAMDLFFRKYGLPANTLVADARLINFSEKQLTGTIGGASAKILISSVVKEEKVTLPEVLKILEESKEAIASNKLLQDKSEELFALSAQLKEANKELIQKDKQKDDFLDTVAHEIKTPLTGIKGATEILLDDEDEIPQDVKQQFLKNILQDTDRLSRLIQNILDFEKLDTERDQLDLKLHNFKNTVKIVIDSLTPIANKQNAQVIFHKGQKVFLEYDQDRIIQVLTNLVSNALNFCNQEAGIITIKYQITKDYLEASVADNGHGVPQEDIEYIFDKFYQSKNQNTIKPKGSGLGLAIAKHIILKHGGNISVKNQSNSGAIFTFKIPISKTLK